MREIVRTSEPLLRPRRFLGARALATPAESQAKQSTKTGRARALVVGEKAMFRQLTNGLINGIFESLNDGPAVVLPALRKLGHSDEGKSSWDGPAV